MWRSVSVRVSKSECVRASDEICSTSRLPCLRGPFLRRYSGIRAAIATELRVKLIYSKMVLPMCCARELCRCVVPMCCSGVLCLCVVVLVC